LRERECPAAPAAPPKRPGHLRQVAFAVSTHGPNFAQAKTPPLRQTFNAWMGWGFARLRLYHNDDIAPAKLIRSDVNRASGIDRVMNHQEIMGKISEVMMDVFDVDDLEVTENTSADQVEEWDSLSHIRFMITIERTFKIKFRNEEIADLQNVGDLAKAIEAKLNA
jgi:acyl carrier protein